MAKILVIGVGSSQKAVIENLQETLPNSRCVLIDFGVSSRDTTIESYNLVDNSSIAKNIIGLGCMPGSTMAMLGNRSAEIVAEQIEELQKFLGFYDADRIHR